MTVHSSSLVTTWMAYPDMLCEFFLLSRTKNSAVSSLSNAFHPRALAP